MRLRKKDMGGAATVLGLGEMLMGVEADIDLRILIPAVENSVSGASFRPGDVITARNGLAVEIDNTDAEGRLILSDALTLACEDPPDLLIDMATLTGSARVALGPSIAPFYTDDDLLAEAFVKSAGAVADPVWRLPLYREYFSYLDSGPADFANSGDTPFAGSIVAALFLDKFVPSHIRWMHFDIYAWTPRPRPGRPQGGESHGARALFHMLKQGDIAKAG